MFSRPRKTRLRCSPRETTSCPIDRDYLHSMVATSIFLLLHRIQRCRLRLRFSAVARQSPAHSAAFDLFLGIHRKSWTAAVAAQKSDFETIELSVIHSHRFVGQVSESGHWNERQYGTSLLRSLSFRGLKARPMALRRRERSDYMVVWGGCNWL